MKIFIKITLMMFSAFAIVVQLNADPGGGIIQDGTMNTSVRLAENDYEITGGKPQGNNLFHSFSQFNLETGERAIFSGPDNLRNIISRVTGGDPSWIDGNLCSTIPGADLYLLNPAGLMFGPNSSLDIGGSFHISTADYLRMGENEKFYTQVPENDVLSAEPPTAFGFLDEDIAPISFKGKGYIPIDDWDGRLLGLWTPEGKTISVIGGDIEAESGNVLYTDKKTFPIGTIVATKGRINMASLASAGEVVPTESDLNVSSFEKFGNITLSEHTSITSGGGNFYIRAGQVFLDASYISSGQVRIADIVTHGDASGNMDIKADSLTISNGSAIACNTYNEEHGGNIDIRVSESVNISGYKEGWNRISIISSRTFDQGNAGHIRIHAKNITMDGAVIESRSTGLGRGGDIILDVSESVNAFGVNFRGGSGGILATSESQEPGARAAGDVTITAKNISFRDGGGVTASTLGTGDGGNIKIDADTIGLAGVNPHGEIWYAFGSGIGAHSQTDASNAGHAGTIEINSRSLSVTDGAEITTSTWGSGNGGNININVSESVHIAGDASDIELKEPKRWQLKFQDSPFYRERVPVSGIYSRSESPESYAGNASDITLKTHDLTLSDNGTISTAAVNAGGGKIIISPENSLNLSEGEITTSVQNGAGNGGDITISKSQFAALNHGKIKAKAYEGDGGNIKIATDQFVQSSDSIVDASSELGIDGQITIESPDTDISRLTTLPSDLTDTGQWAKTPCQQGKGQKISRFAVTERDGIPAVSDDWVPAHMAVITDQLPNHDEISAKGLITDETVMFIEKGDFANLAQLLEKNMPTLLNAILLSQAYSMSGHYHKALEKLSNVSELAETSGNLFNRALYFTTLGDLYLCIGNTKPAIKYLTTASRLADGSMIMAASFNNLGNIRAVGKDYKGALSLYHKAGSLIRESDQAAALKSAVMINIARAEFKKRDYQNALVFAEQAGLAIKDQRDNYHKASNLISLGLLTQKLRAKHPEALKSPETWLLQAAHIGETIRNHRIISCAYGWLGRYYEENRLYSDAVKMTRKAIFSAQQGYFPEILYRWQWQMGRLFKQEGNIEKAVKSYQGAIATLNPIRMEFFNGHRNREKTFDKNVKKVYLGLSEILLDQAETDRSANHLRKARDTIELLKKAELEDFFHDECVTTRRQETGTVEYIPPGTAVVYPISSENYLTLLLALPDGMSQVKVPVSGEHLSRTAKIFREQTEDWEEDFMDNAMQLYDWLIRPAEAEFTSRDTDTLIFVPDGALCMVPFSALHDGTHFLVQKYALGTVPAISLTGAGKVRHKMRHLLLNGLSEARHGFAPLEGVEQELDALRTAIGGKVLMNREFTTNNLIAEVRNKDYDILHMATHTVFGSSPEKTFLLTYDGRLTMDQLEQIVALNRLHGRQLELLTLSACGTAMGDERAAFGLAGVALKAGAKSAVATLWPVFDKAMFLMVNEFYLQLREPGISKAKALQNAQKKLIARSEYEHPAFWSPFLLIGNWM